MQRPDYKGKVKSWAAEARGPVGTLAMVGHNSQQNLLVREFRKALEAKYGRNEVPKSTRVVLSFDIDGQGEWSLAECSFDD